MSQNEVESEQPKVEEQVEEAPKARKESKAKATSSQGTKTMTKEDIIAAV
jgi:hypothetical protein